LSERIKGIRRIEAKKKKANKQTSNKSLCGSAFSGVSVRSIYGLRVALADLLLSAEGFFYFFFIIARTTVDL
jgi:hypothetical protein